MSQSSEILSRFGKALKRARTEANMTLAEAAGKAGMSRQKWFQYETGTVNVTLLTAQRLAGAVQVEVDQLLSRTFKP